MCKNPSKLYYGLNAVQDELQAQMRANAEALAAVQADKARAEGRRIQVEARLNEVERQNGVLQRELELMAQGATAAGASTSAAGGASPGGLRNGMSARVGGSCGV